MSLCADFRILETSPLAGFATDRLSVSIFRKGRVACCGFVEIFHCRSGTDWGMAPWTASSAWSAAVPSGVCARCRLEMAHFIIRARRKFGTLALDAFS
jgi:hypothetical protein